MSKAKLILIALLLSSVCLGTTKGQAENKLSAAVVKNSIPVQIKIVVSENRKETKSYLFDFNAAIGQEVTYEGNATLPYSQPSEKDKSVQETSFISLGNEFAITPYDAGADTVINFKISMAVDLGANNSVPVISSFDYAGFSVHTNSEFLKVFSGPLMDSSIAPIA